MAVALVLCTARPAAGGQEWDSEAALRLVDRAIEQRRHAWADSTLRQFRAETRSHVYYLGEFLGERHVIRADQIALHVRWQAPDRTTQTIVGRRHEKRLPTTVSYHLDHLFLILDNFGDRIRLGEGDEVADVRHPAGAGAPGFYEYRLADSLEIRLRDRTARVFEVEVRPREAGAAGAVGSLFIDRETGALARMRLTFTPAAYHDPQIVRPVVDLRSALWEGRHWLPDQQDVEITRALPWLDFPLRTVVRIRLRVLGYDFDEEPGVRLAPGHLRYSRPEEALARFDAWESSLFAGPHEAEVGGDPRGDLDEVVAHARELLSRELFGGRRWRLALPKASAGFRARRSEGFLVGAGGAYHPGDLARVTFWGGVATGEARPQASLQLRNGWGALEMEVDGWLRAHRDAGPAAAAGVLQTVALLAEGEDYEDPYFATGGRLGIASRAGTARWRLGASLERHERAELVVEKAPLGGGTPRPVRAVDEGDLASVDAGLEVHLGSGFGARWGLEIAGQAAVRGIGDFGYTCATAALRGVGHSPNGAWSWRSVLETGLAGGELPAQRLFLLGGRGSVPGHDFRAWGGDRFALWRGEASRVVSAPWVRIRGLAAVGWVGIDGAGGGAAERFGVMGSAGVRGSVGLGLGLFHDILRLDLVRALQGDPEAAGGWTLLLSLDPRLRGIL